MGLLDSLVMPSSVYGSAKFMGSWDKLMFLNSFNKGLVIDGKRRISLNNSFAHLLLAAPSGAGKTTQFILPNILRLKRTSAVIFDPSQELYQLSNKYLKRQGYTLKTLNATDLSVSARYNPLQRVNDFTDIRKLCDILISAAFPNSSGADDFWNNSAKGIIELLIRVVKNLAEEKQTLKEVYRILNRIETNVDEVNKLMAENLDDDGFDQFKAFVAGEQKLKNSILTTARTALGKLSDPDIAELTSNETLDFESLRTEKTALFITIEESETEYYAFILTILYTQLFGFCLKMPEKGKKYLPIFFLMDEFANSGKIPGFATLITVLRRRKVSLSLIIQSLAQLESIYGKTDAEIIIGNCASQIYYSGLPLEDNERLERILGKTTLLHEEKNQKRFEASNIKELGRSLMTAQEIRIMNKAIYIYSNLLPILIMPRPYYESRKLNSRTK